MQVSAPTTEALRSQSSRGEGSYKEAFYKNRWTVSGISSEQNILTVSISHDEKDLYRRV